MTVQLSVLLWTVICFGAVVLILNNLLFKPILAHMDRRAERIRAAAVKKERNEMAAAEAEEALRRFSEEQEKHTAALTEKALSGARAESERLILEAGETAERNAEKIKAEITDEIIGTYALLEARADAAAEEWLSSLIKDGRGG